jgi:hypothetical protein
MLSYHGPIWGKRNQNNQHSSRKIGTGLKTRDKFPPFSSPYATKGFLILTSYPNSLLNVREMWRNFLFYIQSYSALREVVICNIAKLPNPFPHSSTLLYPMEVVARIFPIY